MGLIMAHAAYRAGERLTCLVYTGAIGMLIAITATPSVDSSHILISLLLPLTLHAFYVWFLRSVLNSGVCTVLHLFSPLLLLFAVQFHSYGAWQKTTLLYFVLVANLHYSLLPHPARKKARGQTASKTSRHLERLIAEGWIDTEATLTVPRR
jgi:hypothetical protein